MFDRILIAVVGISLALLGVHGRWKCYADENWYICSVRFDYKSEVN